MEKARALLRVPLILLLVSCVLPAVYAQGTSQPSQQDFENQLVTALDKGDNTLLRASIRDHRLLVKPFIDRLITESMQLEIQDEKQKAEQKLEIARTVAGMFESTFGEKSLVTAVAYLSSWSKVQKQKKLLADSLYALGTKLRGKKEQRDEALAYYLRALDIYREIRDLRGEGTTLGGLGFIYWDKRDPGQALPHFQKALEVRQKVDDKQLVGNSYNDIGSVYYNFFQEYPKALENHLQAEKIRTEIGDEAGFGRTLANIALAYWDMGELDQAFAYYNKAIAVNRKLGDENRMASGLYNCGIILTDLGKYSEALGYLERALNIREKQADKKGLGDVLNRRGIVYRRLGEFELALDSYQKVIRITEELRNESGLADALSNMGVVLQHLEQTEKASEYYEKSLGISQKLGDQSGALARLTNLGGVYFDLENYAKSEEYHLKALQMSRELLAKTLEANNLIGLGNAQNFQGNYEPAFANYQAGLKIAQATNSPELIWPALLGLGDNYERRNDYDKALNYYSQAFEAIEEVRGSLQSEQYKASFLAGKRFAYEAVIHFLNKLHQKDNTVGYDRQAFYYAERAKARAFLDLLAEALANVSEGADPNLLQRQNQLLNELSRGQQQLQLESSKAQTDEVVVAKLKDQTNALETEYRKLQREISLKNPRYSELQYPQPITLKEAQSNVLDGNTVLLEYSLGDSSSSLWVITKDSSQLYRLPDRETLQEQVEIVRFALSNPQQSPPEFFAKSGHRLYQLLVQPAETLIKKDKRLLVIPDGVLHYLPFEILLTEKINESAQESYARLPFLIKRNAISYGQSASVLQNLKAERKKRQRSRQKQLLALGDPFFGEAEAVPLARWRGIGDTTRAGLARLPHSGAEVQNIAKFFPPGRVDIHLRQEAIEERVKANEKLAQYQYVHFATHGLINERKPDFSSIVLSQDTEPKEDGFLQAAEIFNLKLQADLVVLSACQTGLGKMVRGEGMMGLTRAFMYAGAPSVVVSLWSVSDVSTSKLMEKFYQNLIVKNHDKTESLRQAKLAMLEQDQFSHPFYWAPFVLIGDWQER